jgi:hypothetical protein
MTPFILTARNVNHAFKEGFWWLKVSGNHEDTRNGPCLVAPGPVITHFISPWERVLFNSRRDANPVFHLLEAIWMLGGHDRVEHLEPFNSNFVNYAEDNGRIHGAYGARWRYRFDKDQVVHVIEMLKKDRNTRRVVVQMWDADKDLGVVKKDIPCNTHIYFDCRFGKLNMTVCCRSNDMLWGAYGANVVHFSILQELIACAVGIPMGEYFQMSNNFHVYTNLPMVQSFLDSPDTEVEDPYNVGVQTIPLLHPLQDYQDFLRECQLFFVPRTLEPKSYFLREVANPLRHAYLARKEGRPFGDILAQVPECDWKLAFQQWISRREANAN